MKLKHLFWDFDGTLYDSYPKIVTGLFLALDELGIAQDANPREALRLLKTSVSHALTYYANQSNTPMDIMKQTFLKHHLNQIDFKPYAGMESCLRRLSDAGIRHYLYTHRNGQAIIQLKDDGLYSFFTDAVTQDDGFPSKPAPDALLSLMERNGIMPNQAAMIGDRAIDTDAGHNAGMMGILFDPDDFYAELDVDLRVTSLDELCTKILSMQ